VALTSIPAAGAKLRGSVLSALITEVRPLFVRKASDETVNGSATLQNDDELFLAVEANVTYQVEASLRYSTGATPNLKFTFTGPSGATGLGHATSIVAGGTALVFTDVTLLSTVVTADDSSFATEVHGVLIVGATAGTLQLQWAQNTSNASDTKVLSGSYLKLVRTS